MPRMEKFLDGKAFSLLKFVYVSSIMVNSKITLSTVVYNIVVDSYSIFAETLFLLVNVYV